MSTVSDDKTINTVGIMTSESPPPALQNPSAQSQISPHRESISQALTSYYILLTQFPYLPDDAIQQPPPDGWNLNAAADLRRIANKSAAVIDVLNHIPYLIPATFEINYDTLTRDWRGDTVRTTIAGEGVAGSLGPSAAHIPRLQQASLEPMSQTLPESVIALSNPTNYGRWLLLNVDTGFVTNYSVLGGPNPMSSDEEWEAGVAWKNYETRPITDLLEDWSEKLRSLLWVPLPSQDGTNGSIRTPSTVEDPDQEGIRSIYRSHGWHHQHRVSRSQVEDTIKAGAFRKDECRAALIEWQQEDSRKRMARYNDTRGAKAVKRRARLAAAEITEDREPTWSGEGK